MLELDEATDNHALSTYAFFVWKVCTIFQVTPNCSGCFRASVGHAWQLVIWNVILIKHRILLIC